MLCRRNPWSYSSKIAIKINMALHDSRHTKLHRCAFESCYGGQRYFLHIGNVVGRTSARYRAFRGQRWLTYLAISAATYFEYSSENVHLTWAGPTAHLHACTVTKHWQDHMTTQNWLKQTSSYSEMFGIYLYISPRDLLPSILTYYSYHDILTNCNDSYMKLAATVTDEELCTAAWRYKSEVEHDHDDTRIACNTSQVCQVHYIR